MKLYLVPTPVGNLGDMTYRAVEVLKSVDLILAEDTRTSRVLLQHYDIATPMQAYHIFNEHQIVDKIIEKLQGGTSIAVVTDAGTPGISDPGFLLVRDAVTESMLSASQVPQPSYLLLSTAVYHATASSLKVSYLTRKDVKRLSSD